MRAGSTLDVRGPWPAIGAAVVVLSVSAPAIAAETAATPAPIKIAARSIEAEPSAFALGRPVVVTRADVESPLARVRSIELDASTSSGDPRPADPAFKAVLLTPRESTGRPAQPLMPEIPVSEPGAELASVDPDDRPDAAPKPRQNPAPSTATRERAVPLPSSRQPPPKMAAVAPTARVAASPQVPARKPAAAPAPRFGAAEIAATRAFTRF